MSPRKRKSTDDKPVEADAAGADVVEPTEPAAVELDPSVRHEHVTADDGHGFVGVKVDPYPNEAYSLESGPASPGVVEAHRAVEAANQPEALEADDDPAEVEDIEE